MYDFIFLVIHQSTKDFLNYSLIIGSLRSTGLDLKTLEVMLIMTVWSRLTVVNCHKSFEGKIWQAEIKQ